jgi:hypothetical protein
LHEDPVWALAILAVTWVSARADIPPPPHATKAELEAWQRGREANQRARFGFPPKPLSIQQTATKMHPLVVNANAGLGWMRLVLPDKLIQDLQTAQTGSGSFQVHAPEKIRTFLAGLALSLAVVTGGLWLSRSRRRLAFGTAAFVLVTTTVLGIGCIHTKNKTTENQQVQIRELLVQTPDGKLKGQAVLEISHKETEQIELEVDTQSMGQYIGSSGIKVEFEN